MPDNKEEFPSLPEQGKNIAKFTFEVVKNVIDISPRNETKLIIPEEEQKQRLDVCKKCDYYSVRQNRCRHCGAPLEGIQSTLAATKQIKDSYL